MRLDPSESLPLVLRLTRCIGAAGVRTTSGFFGQGRLGRGGGGASGRALLGMSIVMPVGDITGPDPPGVNPGPVPEVTPGPFPELAPGHAFCGGRGSVFGAVVEEASSLQVRNSMTYLLHRHSGWFPPYNMVAADRDDASATTCLSTRMLRECGSQ